jgi:hypothetical protein
MITERRLYLALAWGKWLALRQKDCEAALQFYTNQRPRKNWAILVEEDEWALRYQRLIFRQHRVLRALGAWGLIGYATFSEEGEDTVTILGVNFPVNRASMDEVARMNYNSFNLGERHRAFRAKQLAEDKRHPIAAYQDHCAKEEADAIQAEMAALATGRY